MELWESVGNRFPLIMQHNPFFMNLESLKSLVCSHARGMI